MRRGSSLWVVIAIACGPDAAVDADDGSSSTSTTSSDGGGDTTSDEGAPDTGAPGSTTGMDATTSTTTGEVMPACETPGACDDCVQWETIVEGRLPTSIEHVAIAPDGAIVTIVAREGGPEGLNQWLQVLDADGSASFESAIHEEGVDQPVVAALEVGTDGAIAILRTERVGEFRFLTTLDVRAADGSADWTAVLGDERRSVVGMDTVFADDGTIVVVGGVNDGPVSYEGFASAHAPDGSVVWELDAADLGVGFGSVSEVVSAGAGELALAGYTDSELWLGWIEADGAVAWSTTVVAGEGIDRSVEDLAISFDGEILVVGSEYTGGQWPTLWLGRFVRGGREELSVAYRVVEPGSHYFDAIEVPDDGRIFVAGVRSNGVESTLRFVQELDCDGAVAWEWTHANPSANDYANAGGLAWSPALGLVAGGSDYLDESEDYRKRGFVTRLMP